MCVKFLRNFKKLQFHMSDMLLIFMLMFQNNGQKVHSEFFMLSENCLLLVLFVVLCQLMDVFFQDYDRKVPLVRHYFWILYDVLKLWLNS